MGKGRVATCYLGEQHRSALDAAIEKTGWMHNHYVRIAVLEKLVADGFLDPANVTTEIEKANFRKDNPHPNSKRARQRASERGGVGARLSQEVAYEPAEARLSAREPAPARPRVTASQRRELRAKRRARNNANVSQQS